MNGCAENAVKCWKSPLGVNISTLSVHNKWYIQAALEDFVPETSCCSEGTVSDSIELERRSAQNAERKVIKAAVHP